jgi:hypothetical protein
VGWNGTFTSPGYEKRTLGLEPDRRCRLRYGLGEGELRRGFYALWLRWVFCTIMVPGERTHNGDMVQLSDESRLDGAVVSRG